MDKRQLFLRNVAQTSDAPLMLDISRGEGIYLYDASGKRYLDLISGISVCQLGHSHPKVVEAIRRQSEKYMHVMVYGEFVQSPQVDYATLLVQHLPAQLNNVYFVNSGTEATEGALKLAKRFTGRSEVVSFCGGYHGSSMGALSAMGDEYFKRNYRPLVPGSRVLNYNNPDELDQISCRTAAVIIETVQAESGITPPDPAYLQALRKRCNEVGALLILDEIQCGIGRSGKLFAFQHYKIEPDILLLAKALGGGMPLGAFISSREIMSVLQENPYLGHITTFGGHPVCCAAGRAAFEAMLEGDYIKTVAEKSRLFEELLVHEAILALRRKGMLLAIEFESYEFNKKVIDGCAARGLITDWFLFNSRCLRISPPLIITKEQIREACDIILDSVSAVMSEPPIAVD